MVIFPKYKNIKTLIPIDKIKILKTDVVTIIDHCCVIRLLIDYIK